MIAMPNHQDPAPRQVGTTIRILRRAQLWSRQELQQRIACSASTVAAVERGSTLPSLWIGLRLMQALGIPDLHDLAYRDYRGMTPPIPGMGGLRPDPDPKQVGHTLQTLRREHPSDTGVCPSRREIARMVGVSATTVSNTERGRSLPSLVLTLRLMRLFGVRSVWSLCYEDLRGAMIN